MIFLISFAIFELKYFESWQNLGWNYEGEDSMN